MGERPWPLPIEVGTRVHHGISSPDTGVVLSITKNRRWAKVQWDCNGVRRSEMRQLFSVTRSLTEWAVYARGKVPCPNCGHEVYPPAPAGTRCHLCQMPNAQPTTKEQTP